MKRDAKSARGAVQGPSQRQLRAGELVRHALADILRDESFAEAQRMDALFNRPDVRRDLDHKED